MWVGISVPQVWGEGKKSIDLLAGARHNIQDSLFKPAIGENGEELTGESQHAGFEAQHDLAVPTVLSLR